MDRLGDWPPNQALKWPHPSLRSGCGHLAVAVLRQNNLSASLTSDDKGVGDMGNTRRLSVLAVVLMLLSMAASAQAPPSMTPALSLTQQ